MIHAKLVITNFIYCILTKQKVQGAWLHLEHGVKPMFFASDRVTSWSLFFKYEQPAE